MKRLDETKDYLKVLKERGRESHVHRSYQFIGLEIATTLRDLDHKSLYMKLAKEYDEDRLLELAKSVAERRGVENRGAYFMKLLEGMHLKPKASR